MTSSARTETAEEQLYALLPGLPAPLRAHVAAAVVEVGEPQGVAALARLAATSVAPELLRDLVLALERTQDQSAVNALCEVWAETRSPMLDGLLKSPRWIASEPLTLKVLSSLRVGELEGLLDEGVEVIEPLLRACHDTDAIMADHAKLALRSLTNMDARERLCRLAIEQDHSLAMQLAVAAGYLPKRASDRALYLFLSEQWPAYEQLDGDRRLLREAYAAAHGGLQARIQEAAQDAGRGQWIDSIAAPRPTQTLAAMGPDDWDAALQALGDRQDWAALWRLAQVAPAYWSKRLLARLETAGWWPESLERACFEELVGLGARCPAALPGLGGLTRRQKIVYTSDKNVSEIAVSADQRHLATITDNMVLSMVEMATGRILFKEKLAAWLWRPAFHPRQAILAYSFTNDLAIELRSVPDGRLLQRLSGHSEPATALAFSPDGHRLASACHGKRLIIWDLASGSAIKRMEGVSVDSLRFTPDGQHLFGVVGRGEREKCLQIWDLNGKPLSEVPLHAKRLEEEDPTTWINLRSSVPHMNRLSTISPSCSLISVGDKGDNLEWGWAGGSRPSAEDAYLFHASGRQLHHQILTDCRMIYDLAISPDDQVLAGTSFDGLCDLVDTQTGLTIRAFKGDEPFHHGDCLALSESGELLVLADQYRQVYAFASDLPPLLRRPLADLTEQDAAWLRESAARDDLTGGERHWLAFVQAQLRWKKRFNVGLAQSQQWIPAGDFDIEL